MPFVTGPETGESLQASWAAEGDQQNGLIGMRHGGEWLMEYWTIGVLVPQWSLRFAPLLLLQYSIAPNLLPRAQLVDGFDHGDHVIDRRFRQHAMSQVENMAGTSVGAAQNIGDTAPISFGDANRATGSRLPCTATSCPTVAQPSSRFIRQSRPITSPPAARICFSNPAVPVLKLITGTPG